MTADAEVGTEAGVAGVVLMEIDGFSEEAFYLPFATAILENIKRSKRNHVHGMTVPQTLYILTSCIP